LCVGSLGTVCFVLAAELFGFVIYSDTNCMCGGGVTLTFEFTATTAA